MLHKGYYVLHFVLHFVLHLGDMNGSNGDKIDTYKGMERGMD